LGYGEEEFYVLLPSEKKARKVFMKRINRMVLQAFIGPFIMSLMIILFILVLQFISLYMNEIMGKGLSPVVLGKLFLYAAGKVLLTAMPIGILTAGLMTFGSMGEHYELAAMKATGINLFKIMMAPVGFTAIVTVLSIWLSFEVIPRSNLKFFSLLYDVQRKKADLALKPGHFYSGIDDYVIRISDKHPTNGSLYDVLIYNHSENRGNNDIIRADSARMDLWGSVMRMTLYNGDRYEEYKPKRNEEEKYPHGRTHFDSLYYKFELKGFELNRTDEKQFRHQMIMPRKQLMTAIDSLDGVAFRAKKKAMNQMARYHKIDSAFITRAPDTTQGELNPIKQWVVLTFDREAEDPILSCMGDEERLDVSTRALTNIKAIKSYAEFMIRKEEDQIRTEDNYQYEFFQRWAMPLNCLIFALLGVSLGAIIRKGGLGPPALVSLVMFLVFYVLTTQGKKLAKEGILSPELGAFLPLLIFAPLTVYVTYQAAMDARLFDESSWAMWRDRLRSLFTRKKEA